MQLDPGQWRYGKMLADHYIAEKKYSEALAVAKEYNKRFQNDFRLNMLLAKTMLLNNQYKATTDLLAKTTILPYEGATDGRQLYREAWLMQAVQALKVKNNKLPSIFVCGFSPLKTAYAHFAIGLSGCFSIHCLSNASPSSCRPVFFNAIAVIRSVI